MVDPDNLEADAVSDENVDGAAEPAELGVPRRQIVHGVDSQWPVELLPFVADLPREQQGVRVAVEEPDQRAASESTGDGASEGGSMEVALPLVLPIVLHREDILFARLIERLVPLFSKLGREAAVQEVRNAFTDLQTAYRAINGGD